MQSTFYNIGDAPRNVSLAEESWKLFCPYVSRYQWALDQPSHSPRKEEIAHAILNRGKKGACTFSRPEGYRYVLPVLHPRHLEKALNGRRKIYYVSYGSQALLYLDVDIHYDWPKPGYAQHARERIDHLLRGFFGGDVIFWSPSSRGINGYVKVKLERTSYPQANEVFGRLERALQRFLASCENQADFEVKGTCGYLQNGEFVWGKYGKLPVHSPGWNFARAEEFQGKRAVSIHKFAALCKTIEDQVPSEILERHKACKAAKGNGPITERGFFLVTPEMAQRLEERYGEDWRYHFDWGETEDDPWVSLKHFRSWRLPATLADLRAERETSTPRNADALRDQLEAVYHRVESPEAQNPDDSLHLLFADLCNRLEAGPQPDTRKGRRAIAQGQEDDRGPGRQEREAPRRTVESASRSYLDLADLAGEADSFQRQSEALRRLARFLKRVPSFDEGLDFLKDNSLFTGPWEENLSRRQTRVKSILRFVARTFDARKCGNGSVNVGKYDAWARRSFPTGLVGGKGDYLTEEGTVVRFSKNVRVGPEFIGVFMAVCEFALLIDKNRDDSLPHARAEELWDKLHAEGVIAVKFDARKWAVCRDQLEKHGIIQITDRCYGHGKAMKWAVGLYFPFLGLWKASKQPSRLGPVGTVTVFSERGEREETHNTLLHWQSPRGAVSAGSRLPRPPP
jgi:hypothetical protein